MENNNNVGSSSAAAPTGCYKCGRPGHWSRDCPSNPNPNSNPNNNNTNNTDSSSSNLNNVQKPKIKKRSSLLPKLTPEMLLSEAGFGHILRYFPPAIKSRGRGYEVDDLQHLLGMYAEWHSRLLPYYNFSQFIHKVEQVAATKRVKVSLRELRDRISNGADPTKLHEKQDQQTNSFEQDAQGGVDMPSHSQGNTLQKEGTSDVYEDMPQDFWEDATEDMSQPSHVKSVPSGNVSVGEEVPHQIPKQSIGGSTLNLVSEEQKARMEANRLKALERAAARRSLKS